MSVIDTLRALAVPVYVPSLMVNVCQGLIVPVLPLMLRALDASDTVISLVFALTGMGKAFADIPAGHIALRFGDVNTMRGAMALYAAVTLVAVLYPTVPVILAVCTVWGACLGVFAVARGSVMTRIVTDKEHRGRASSLLGGVGRLASAVGPLLGGFVAHYVSFGWALFSVAPMALVGLGSLMLVRENSAVVVASDDEMETMNEEAPADVPYPTLWGTLRDHRRFFFTVGMFNFLMFIPRTARKLILPLGGADIHLTASEVGMLTSLSWSCDAALFWTSGILMDKLGRKWSGVPSNVVMGLGFLVLGAHTSPATLYGAAVMMGVGNSMSSGLANTLGLDFAPKDHPSVFLAIHRFLADSGIMVGPVLAGLILDHGGYEGACIGIAIVSALCTAWLLLVVDVTPKT